MARSEFMQDALDMLAGRSPEHRQNAPCQRCGKRPHSWFWDGGYVCSPCMDEWTAFKRYVLDNVPHNGGPLPLHNRPDGTPCNYAAMTKSNGQWVCTKCGAGGSANGGSDG